MYSGGSDLSVVRWFEGLTKGLKGREEESAMIEKEGLDLRGQSSGA